jgi:hypothetical protein
MKERSNDRVALAMVIVMILLATAFESFLLYETYKEDAEPHPDLRSQYYIKEPMFNSTLTSQPSDLNISNMGSSCVIRYTTTGMMFDFIDDDDRIGLSCEKNVDTVALSLNILEAMHHFSDSMCMEYNFSIYNDIYYTVNFKINFNTINITYTFLDDTIRTQLYGDMLYDSWSELDILVHIKNGFIETGVNGISHISLGHTSSNWQPKLETLSIAPGNKNSLNRSLWLNSLQLGFETEFRYQDGLRKTIVPDGKDFAFALHIHADKAYPQQFYLMGNLSERYGLRCTYDAWVYSDGQYYSMQDQEYVAALHSLQDSGWDIGLHGVSSNDIDRSQVILGIENFTAEFGVPTTWSDHGFRDQDLCSHGTDVNSASYDADLVEGIGAAWCHDYHSASVHNDLNHEGMSYQLDGHESLPLFRVSHFSAWDIYGEGGRQADVGEYLRSAPLERSVFVLHEYLPDFFYVMNGTGKYSILPEHDGIEYFPWADLVSKEVFTNDSWFVEPRFQGFLNWTQGYDIWFAPVRDIYDRSEMVQKVSISDESERVIIKNQCDQAIAGFTLYTKAQPDYYLLNGDVRMDPTKGSMESWHFVTDLPAGAEIVLLKKDKDNKNDIGNTFVPYLIFTDDLVMNPVPLDDRKGF